MMSNIINVIMDRPSIIDLERSVNQIIINLTNPNIMYWIFPSLIKNRNNMSLEEKLAYYKENNFYYYNNKKWETVVIIFKAICLRQVVFLYAPSPETLVFTDILVNLLFIAVSKFR